MKKRAAYSKLMRVKVNDLNGGSTPSAANRLTGQQADRLINSASKLKNDL
jgi:hypothetical protein